jgi:hypothetical protein
MAPRLELDGDREVGAEAPGRLAYARAPELAYFCVVGS